MQRAIRYEVTVPGNLLSTMGDQWPLIGSCKFRPSERLFSNA